ncbi:MAG: aspartate--ammonia ligase, partial [Ruminococcaceae bacterium]|nr:aspartate--ammonia ligase [Oscillospiraceae bacterium]
MITIPENYKPRLSVYDTQRAIDYIKRTFQMNLAIELNLRRVSAPLFVRENSGLNDNLNGVERPVGFDIPAVGDNAQVVHSLAKWKRLALGRYDFYVGKGLYTDMNAIRRDEDLDNIHSIYVDQWDWEKVIDRSMRTEDYLKTTVKKIVSAVVATNNALRYEFSQLECHITPEVSFVTSQELEDMYPDMTAKQRENAYVKEHPTTFLMKIGGKLKSGKPHDGRAPDYDDWELNGDLLIWNDVLGIA